jgi:hypothetical protein
VIPGTTPARADDDGTVDAGLADALAGSDPRTVAVALLTARLLVPVLADAGPAGREADLAVPALVDGAGRRALPVFSCVDALRAWRPLARPVPMPGARVIAAAAEEGYDGVVLDVAGPAAYTLDGADLATLARAAAAVLAHPGARVSGVEDC